MDDRNQPTACTQPPGHHGQEPHPTQPADVHRLGLHVATSGGVPHGPRLTAAYPTNAAVWLLFSRDKHITRTRGMGRMRTVTGSGPGTKAQGDARPATDGDNHKLQRGDNHHIPTAI